MDYAAFGTMRAVRAPRIARRHLFRLELKAVGKTLDVCVRRVDTITNVSRFGGNRIKVLTCSTKGRRNPAPRP